ncbi:MAG: diaminopimelate decarboxylase [Deltaproteobacteria bacterium]|uniref:diaminopimelate decarboxylase family protein n=1 Tax=Desulfobacula sp. TaxID=2593537 RepID=UPI0019BAE3F6|nr:diaminopimelate decarboxylase [Candidatus Desulfobacula maris]MBL6995317.1 diaminopimelate decarboxylase [Desulfobacula sp.]
MKKKDSFLIQRLDLHDLCRKFGTPLYVYDANIIKQQVEKFKTAFGTIRYKVMYAVKSCTNISIIKYMKLLGTGLDTVSIPEVHMGLSLGFDPRDIVFTPNVVDFKEIEEAVDSGVSINIENLQNLESFGKKYGSSYPVCVRLNPNMISEIESGKATGPDFASANKEHYGDVSEVQVSAWHNQSKFGISLTQFDDILKLIEQYGLRINGLHLHSSHVILNKTVFEKGVKTLFKIARQFKHLEYIDFGGGIMVKHKPDDVVIELSDAGPVLKREYDTFCSETGKTITVWFEPGRFLMSEAGFLFTETVVLKTNGWIDFVGTNTGFHHLVRPMMYNAYHSIENISNPKGPIKKYNIVGNLCEIDNLACDRELNEVRKKDLLMIKNVGAYGFAMSSNYNSRPKPAEVLIINGQAKLIRKRETYADLVRNQVEIDF